MSLPRGLMPLFLSAAIVVAGCQNREEVLAEWDENFQDLCTSYGPKSEFSDTRNYGRLRADNVLGILEKGYVGSALSQHIVVDDVAMCFGRELVEGHDISRHGKTGAVIFDDTLSDEEAAYKFLINRLSKNSNKLADWSSKLIPEDALALARIIDAHKVAGIVEEIFYTAGRDVTSQFWNTAKADPKYSQYLEAFEHVFSESFDKNEALTAVLESALQIRIQTPARDQAFLKWYQNELQDRLVPVVSPCMDFEGNPSACTSLETESPPT